MASSPMFFVQRREPVLIAPAEQTPHELKPLSDIDDQESMRFQVPVIQYYRNEPKRRGQDPARVIREALAKALVFYYPLAGRLREGPGRKLMVECTGEGVLFVEADANVRLEQFGDALPPPVPRLKELLHDVPGSGGIVDCPLILVQVTRLMCGGFILALRFNHTLCDGVGFLHFMTAVADIARGAPGPTLRPVWARDRLTSPSPPLVTHLHQEFHPSPNPTPGWTIQPNDWTHRSFFFGPKEVSALRSHLPTHLSASSTSEVLCACTWRSRTIALGLNPDEVVPFMCNVNVRFRRNSPVPIGYYGNAFVSPVVLTKAGHLCSSPLGYALDLVKKAKSKVAEGYISSVASLMALEGRPPLRILGDRRTYMVSDVSGVGFKEVDYGWGEAVYGGLADGELEDSPGTLSIYVSFTNQWGEKGVVVPIRLPKDAMARFVMEVERLIGMPLREPHQGGPRFISSSL